MPEIGEDVIGDGERFKKAARRLLRRAAGVLN
jgi:hypothetical protein